MRSTLAFAALLLAGAVLITATGPVPEINYPADTANYLDACGAAASGLKLQHDYFSPIGPAAILPTVMAMRLHGATVTALVWGSALEWLGYGLVAWMVARRRMPGWLACAFALFVAGTAAAPYTLDFGNWHSLSYGMLYNRLAWAALCIAAFPAFLPAPGSMGIAREAAGYGACAAWLWLIKPNYLLIQIPLTVWAMVGIRGHRRPVATLACFAAGLAATAALIGICVPFDPVGYVREHFAMAHDAPPDLLIYTLKRSLRENALPVAMLGLGWLIAAAGVAPSRRAASVLGLFAATAGCSFITNTTNCQFAEFPIWGALGWILATFAWAGVRRAGIKWPVAAVGVALGLAYAWQPWAALPYAFAWKRFHAASDERENFVASPAWAGMPMRYYPGSPPQSQGTDPAGSPGSYAGWLNDGLSLLAHVPHRAGAVLCLDWDNPFPFAIGAKPALGDQIAWHVGRNLSSHHHPDEHALLDQAGVVMDPKRSEQPDSLAFKRALFAQPLHANFTLAAESREWRIWVRTAAALPDTVN